MARWFNSKHFKYVEQPDGTTITIPLYGDPNYGRTVLQSPISFWYESYVQIGEAMTPLMDDKQAIINEFYTPL